MKNSESYSKLTAVKEFYPWWKILKTRAHYEKCGTVLNPTYVPGPDEGEAFEEMKLYLFTVFDATIEEVEGKNIIDRFRNNFDAQGCAAALYQYYTNSPAAGIRRINFSSLLPPKQCLSLSRIRDASCLVNSRH